MSDLKLTVEILAMYLDCEIQFIENPSIKLRLIGIDKESDLPIIALRDRRYRMIYDVGEIKPILRKLTSMTEKEARHYCKLQGWGENMENVVIEDEGVRFGKGNGLAFQNFRTFRPQTFAYLFSKHFDLFGLIDSGLAIEKQ